MAEVEPGARWGTWEELVLGGAVLRHGDTDWVAVAGELRERTRFPDHFSPAECEAKFAEVLKRYSECSTWFEELRRQRVAELKRELQQSENSIWSLESKLKSLKSGSKEGNVVCNAGPPEYINTTENMCDIDSSNKEISTDWSSAGSFVNETPNNILRPTGVSDLEPAYAMKISCAEKSSCLLGGIKLWSWGCLKKIVRMGKARTRYSNLRASDENGNSPSCTGTKASPELCTQSSIESGASTKSDSVDVELTLISLDKTCQQQQKQPDDQKKPRGKKRKGQNIDAEIAGARVRRGKALRASPQLPKPEGKTSSSANKPKKVQAKANSIVPTNGKRKRRVEPAGAVGNAEKDAKKSTQPQTKKNTNSTKKKTGGSSGPSRGGGRPRNSRVQRDTTSKGRK